MNSFVNPVLHSNQMIKKESNITQSILRTEFSEVNPFSDLALDCKIQYLDNFQNLNPGFDVTVLLSLPS